MPLFPQVTETQAVRIDEDGLMTPVPYDKTLGDTAWLTVMQATVKGYIETVPVPVLPGVIMVVNEEGRLKDMAYNPFASMFAEQYIVGPVLLVTLAMMQGDEATSPLDAEEY